MKNYIKLFLDRLNLEQNYKIQQHKLDNKKMTDSLELIF